MARETGTTSPIDTPTSCAPGATPTYLPPLAVPRPAMMPATWVPWPPLSDWTAGIAVVCASTRLFDRAVRAERAGRGEERAEFVGGVASGDHEVRLGDNRFAERVGERGLAQVGVRAVDAAVDNGDGHAATGEAAGVVDTGEAIGGVPHRAHAADGGGAVEAVVHDGVVLDELHARPISRCC